MQTDIGIIDDCSGKGTYWRLQKAKVKILGYDCTVFMETKGGPPGKKHLRAVECWLDMDKDKANWIAREMTNQFNLYVAQNYGLNKIDNESAIWRHIKGINAMHVEENGDVDFEFAPTFDDDHDFAVRIRDGKFYEVMLDG